MVEPKRATAKRVFIGELKSGIYLRDEKSSYLLSKLGDRIARVRIAGSVVDKYVGEAMESIRLDDGTAQIRCKSFDSSVKLSVELGDLVEVIGKVREYSGEVYVLPEVVKRVDFGRFMLHRLEALKRVARQKLLQQALRELKPRCADAEELKRALAKKFNLNEQAAEALLAAEELFAERQVDESELEKQVLALIHELDKGEGCSYSELQAKSGLSPEVFERVVTRLLEQGLCFEPKPGIIKAL